MRSKKGDRLYQKICDWPFVFPHVMEYLAGRILFLYANIMKEKYNVQSLIPGKKRL